LREANPQGGPTPPEAPRAAQPRVEWRWGRFPSPAPPILPSPTPPRPGPRGA
jgi:hypothetical protein